METFNEQAKLFKVLIHPTRIAILNILRGSEHCVCHMEAQLGLRQAYISQQLAVLREAGLIQDRREGWNIFYRVTDPRIYALLDAASQMLASEAWVEPASPNLKPCPCPKCSPVNAPPALVEQESKV